MNRKENKGSAIGRGEIGGCEREVATALGTGFFIFQMTRANGILLRGREVEDEKRGAEMRERRDHSDLCRLWTIR